MMMNLSKYHKEHERYYARSPLRDVLQVQNISNTLKTMADKWEEVGPIEDRVENRYAGCEDLNVLSSIKDIGVLFMEGEGEPREIAKMKTFMDSLAEEYEQAGRWLSNAMEASWDTVGSLIKMPPVAEVLGERHLIIINDWQAAYLDTLTSRLIGRGRALLEEVDFAPEALRNDILEGKMAIKYIRSCTELLDRASKLMCESAMLVHDNDKRWRSFREAVAMLSEIQERP